MTGEVSAEAVERHVVTSEVSAEAVERLDFE